VLERKTPAEFRRPVAVGVVFALTAAGSAAALISPHLRAHLGRTPAGLDGAWWRTVTSLFVQDSVAGALSNLAFLLILGVLAEQVTSRGRWLLAYAVAGLAGEFAGYVHLDVAALRVPGIGTMPGPCASSHASIRRTMLTSCRVATSCARRTSAMFAPRCPGANRGWLRRAGRDESDAESPRGRPDLGFRATFE
jgi:hypothetical protein